MRVPRDLFSIVLPSWPRNPYGRVFFDEVVRAPGKSLPFDAIVDRRSPVGLRRAVVVLATYFRREFGYDFIQYSEHAGDDDERDRAVLWRSKPHLDEKVVGAASFRWRDWDDHPHGYALQWVWFHPYVRRNGYLSQSWPYFRERFGEFLVETPLSPAMEAFMDRHGWPNQTQKEKYNALT